MHQQCPRFEWLQGLKSSGGAPLHVVHIAVAPSQRRSWSKRSGTLGSKLQIKNRVLQIKYTYVYIDGRNYHQPEIRATSIQTLHFWMAMKVRTGGGCSCREVKMDEVKSMNTVSQQSSGSKAQPRTFVATFFPLWRTIFLDRLCKGDPLA